MADGPSPGEVLAHLSFQGCREVPTKSPWRTNRKRYFRWAPKEARVLVPNDGTSGRVQALGPEQNCAVSWSYVLPELTSPVQAVIDPCTATFATATASLWWRSHSCVAGRETVTACFKDSLFRFVGDSAERSFRRSHKFSLRQMGRRQ